MDPNQWPGLIFSSFTARLKALLLLSWLSESSTRQTDTRLTASFPGQPG